MARQRHREQEGPIGIRLYYHDTLSGRVPDSELSKRRRAEARRPFPFWGLQMGRALSASTSARPKKTSEASDCERRSLSLTLPGARDKEGDKGLAWRETPYHRADTTMADHDLRSFIRYISSLWGALGGIAAVFPLADVLFKVIPLPVDAYEKSTAPLAIPIASLVALFTLFYTFVQRDAQSATARRSVMFLMLGMISLGVFFLLGHFEYSLRAQLFPSLDSTDDYVLLLVGVVPFYVAFFGCVTRAFAIMALMEFTRERKLANRSSGRP